MDKNLIMLEAKKELARREFFYFCHLTAPLFYKPEREFLVRVTARAVLRQCLSNGCSAEIKVKK